MFPGDADPESIHDAVPQRRRGVTDDQPVRAFGGAPKALCIREKCCSSLATTSKARPSRPARHDKLAEIVIRAGRQALLVVADEGVRGQGDHRQPNSGIEPCSMATPAAQT